MSLVCERLREFSYVQIPSNKAYNFTGGNFSIEARIRYIGDEDDEKGGIIVQRKGNETDSPHPNFIVRLHEDGAVEFNVSDGTKVIHGKANTDGGEQILLFDGNWHHISAINFNGNLSIFIDGRKMSVIQDPPEKLQMKSDFPIIVGSTWSDNVKDPLSYFIGEIEEVRLWSIALSEQQILSKLNKRLSGWHKFLIGYWPLDDKTATDRSPLKNNGESNQAELTKSDPLPYSLGPYIIANADLIQDFRVTDPEGSQIQECSAYRTVITLRNPDGSPFKGKVWICALDETVIRKEGKDYKINQNTEVAFDTNEGGQIAFTTNAGENLSIPPLNVHTDFMDPSERLIIYRDEALHHRMANTTGQQLRDSSDPSRPALLDKDKFSDEHAKAVADAMYSVMSRSVQQHQTTFTSGLSSSAYGASQSYTSNHHLAPEVIIPGFNPKFERSRVEHINASLIVRQDRPLEYLITESSLQTIMGSGENEIEHHWEFTFNDGKPAYRELSRNEYGTRVGEMIAFSVEDITLNSVDWWSWFVDNTKKAVTAVVKVIEKVVEDIVTGVKKVVKTITTTIEFIGNQVKQFIVTTLEKAVEFVSGIFKQIGIALDKVLNFFCSLFDWDDIQRVKRVLKHTINSAFDHFIIELQNFRQEEQKLFKNLKDNVKDTIDKLIKQLDHSDIHNALNNPRTKLETGARGDWMVSKTFEHAQGGSFKDPVDEIKGQAERLLKRLEEAVTNPDVKKAIKNINDDLLKGLQNPALNILEILKAILEVLKASSLIVLGVVDVMMDAVLTVIEAIISLFRQVLNMKIEIPLISSLYKTYIGKGDELTILDLVSLFIAVPATIFYKTVYGLQAPFTDEKIKEVESKSYLDIVSLAQNGKVRFWFDTDGTSGTAGVVQDEQMSLADTIGLILFIAFEIGILINVTVEPLADAVCAADISGWLSGLSGIAASLLGGIINIFALPLRIDGKIDDITVHVFEWIFWVFMFVRSGVSFIFSFFSFSSRTQKIVDAGSVINCFLSLAHAFLGLLLFTADAAYAEKKQDWKVTLKCLFRTAVNICSVAPGVVKPCGVKETIEETEGISLLILLAVDRYANLAIVPFSIPYYVLSVV